MKTVLVIVCISGGFSQSWSHIAIDIYIQVIVRLEVNFTVCVRYGFMATCKPKECKLLVL